MQPRQRGFSLASLTVGALLLASCASLPSTGALGAASSSRQSAASTTAAAATAATAATSTAANTSTAAATTDSVATSTTSSASSSARRRRAARTATSTADAAAATSTSAATGQAANTGSAAAIQAIKDTIQRANEEQAQAFAKNDATLMRDTATTSYYDQLVQNQRDMENGGVSAIKLAKLEWGPVNVQGSSAQATTFETWLTTLSDGSTQQDRERNVYTLVQQGTAWKVQTDAHPDAQLDQSTGGGNPSPTIPSPGVIPGEPGSPSTIPAPLPATEPNNGQSRNWSGYAATGSDFTAVSGTWKVPQVTTNGGYGADASWVGIGGVNTRDLIQAGTDATAAGGGVRYTAWVETLPQVSHTVPLSVSPGDSVSVTISQQSDGTWQIAFKDNTTGQTYQTTTTYNSSLSSAEWVEEAPAGGRRVLPLDNFGTVQFTNGSAVENGKKVTIAQAGAKPITMINQAGQPLAQPSTLSSDGSSFSVKRTADSSTSPVIPGAGQPGGDTGGGFPGGGYPGGQSGGFPGGQGGYPGATQPGSGYPGAGNGVAPGGRGGRGRWSRGG